MKHYFWQHEYIPIKVRHVYAKSMSTLTEKILETNVPATEILKKCKCGKMKTELIEGTWELEDIL